MSNVSTPASTPASTPVSTPVSTSSSTESDSHTLAKEIKKHNTEDFINCLRNHLELGLDEDDLEIIRKRKIDGRAFFNMNKKEFRECGLEIGPITKLLV